MGFGYFLSIQPKKPNNSHSLFNEYEKYMSYTKGDAGCLEVYVEPVTKYENYDYYVTVNNTSDAFACGTLQLLSAKDNVCFEKRYINLKPHEEKLIAIDVEMVPVDYIWKKVSFYEYTYPSVDIDETITYDYDDDMGYYWMNVVTNDQLNKEECLNYAMYMYVQDILAGTTSKDIFFYSREDVTFEQKGNQKYPDINSSYFAAAFDGEKVQIVDLNTSKIILEKLLK